MITIQFKLLKKFKLLGFCFFPFVFVADKNDITTINHEKIHIIQQIECLIIPFYLIYIFEYIFKGYKNISFEKEAFKNELNLSYLKKRKPYSWLKNTKLN